MSSGRRRYLRTILLGVAALGLLLWTAVAQFNVPLADIRELLIGTLVALALVIGAAAGSVAILLLARRGWRALFQDDS